MTALRGAPSPSSQSECNRLRRRSYAATNVAPCLTPSKTTIREQAARTIIAGRVHRGDDGEG